MREEELRDYLPGVEPERRLTDWGRSERIEGLLDRTLVDFFYKQWFRAEVEGIENVPADGGALLVSNHSGALPPDAAMIGKAIKEEHPRPRPLNITVEHFFKGYPGFSMLIPKIGCVAAHPANVHRLLADEEQLVLVFPEGRKGTEKLYKDRYRLRRFGRGGFVEAAMRAQAPIVPVAVVGAEEAAPGVRPAEPAEEAHRAPVLPDHADLPALRPARDAGLPAGQVQAALPAADPLRRARPARGQGPGADGGPRRARPHPGGAAGHGGQAALGLVRVKSKRILITGPVHLLGRPPGPGAGGRRRIEALVGVDNEEPSVELERTEYVKVGTQHALLRRVVEAAEIDTVVDTRLVVDSVTTSPRKAHENNVIGTMNILAACSGPDSPVQKLVFKSSAHFYGCEQDDPAFFDESMGRPHAPKTPIERDIVEAEASLRRLRREEPDGRRDRAALRQRPRPRRAHLAHRPALAPGRAR